MKSFITCVVAVILCSGCSVNGIKKDFDRSGKVLNVTVTQYQPTEFKHKVKEYYEGLLGQSEYFLGNNHTCNISMKRAGPIKLDDKYTLTLGHELMHCLYGNYHD